MSAIFLPTNMHIRNDTYHYRRRIPADLFHLFNRKEVTKFLRTKRPLDAIRLKNRLDTQIEQLFHACRMTGNPAEGLGLKDARREDEIRRAHTPEE